MRRLFPILRWFWTGLLFALLTSIIANYIYALMSGNNVPSLTTMLGGPFPWWRVAVGALCALLIMTIWSFHAYKAQARELLFPVLKRASDLRPSDIGFQTLRSQSTAKPGRRPYYDTYVNRRFVPCDRSDGAHPDPVYCETDILESLKAGNSIVVIGQPTDGKTRTAFEIIRRMRGWVVVRPPKQGPIRQADASAALKDTRVVLLADDLQEYVGGSVDLEDLLRVLTRVAKSAVFVATCRDGAELEVLRKALHTSVYRVFEDAPLKLRLLPPTANEINRLRDAVGVTHDTSPDEYPTLGSVVMAEPLRAMKERFFQLSETEKDLLRALHLLRSAGVLLLTQTRIRAVLEGVFNRRVHDLRDILGALKRQAFLRNTVRDETVVPEPAYVTNAVTYTDGKSVHEDWPALQVVLAKLGDYTGLLDLGALHLSRDHHQVALDISKEILQIEPQCSGAHFLKGFALFGLQNYEEALNALDAGLSTSPDHSLAWMQKGRALRQLGRHEEALHAVAEALRLDHSLVAAWCEKGLVLMEMKCFVDAAECFNSAAELNHEFFQALVWKSEAL